MMFAFTMKLFRRRRFLKYFFLCWILFAFVYFVQRTDDATAKPRPRKNRSNNVCHLPELHFDKSLEHLFHHPDPLVCPEAEWLFLADGKIAWNHDYLNSKKMRGVECKVREIRRVDDFKIEYGKWIPAGDGDVCRFEYMLSECSAKNDDGRQSARSIHAQVLAKREVLERKKHAVKESAQMDLSVILLGIDSVSSVQYKRLLPKTYDYITNVLGGVQLTGYNVVGDGTPACITSMLTGKFEEELPFVERNLFKSADYVNVYPMVWKDFAKIGYATLFHEDRPDIGTYTYRLTGFKEQPTDHYGRTVQNAFHYDYRKKKTPYCIGSRPITRFGLDHLTDFMAAYRSASVRQFGILHTSELGHDDINLVSLLDDDVVAFLSDHYENGFLNETVLFMYADHGTRFSDFRQTHQGRLEERMPYWSVVVPPWFAARYPKQYENLKTNAKRLVTPFDIHETLLDLVKFRTVEKGSINERAISLFREIPRDRTCPDAGISDHWCSCLDWSPAAADDAVVVQAARTAVDYLNGLLAVAKEYCVELSLDHVRSAVRLQPSEDMMQTSHGFWFWKRAALVPTVVSEYQITFETTPDHGAYEITVAHYIMRNEFKVKEDSISRINMYGDNPACIYDKYEMLRKYCFCRDKLKLNH